MRLSDLDLTIVVRNDQQYGAELKYLAAAGPSDSPRAKAKRHRLHHRMGFATDLPLNLDKSNV